MRQEKVGERYFWRLLVQMYLETEVGKTEVGRKENEKRQKQRRKDQNSVCG